MKLKPMKTVESPATQYRLEEKINTEQLFKMKQLLLKNLQMMWHRYHITDLITYLNLCHN